MPGPRDGRIARRRTVYGSDCERLIQRAKTLIGEIVSHPPSAFDIQTERCADPICNAAVKLIELMEKRIRDRQRLRRVAGGAD